MVGTVLSAVGPNRRSDFDKRSSSSRIAVQVCRMPRPRRLQYGSPDRTTQSRSKRARSASTKSATGSPGRREVNWWGTDLPKIRSVAARTSRWRSDAAAQVDCCARRRPDSGNQELECACRPGRSRGHRLGWQTHPLSDNQFQTPEWGRFGQTAFITSGIRLVVTVQSSPIDPSNQAPAALK